jgi:hypothetical protein
VADRIAASLRRTVARTGEGGASAVRSHATGYTSSRRPCPFSWLDATLSWSGSCTITWVMRTRDHRLGVREKAGPAQGRLLLLLCRLGCPAALFLAPGLVSADPLSPPVARGAAIARATRPSLDQRVESLSRAVHGLDRRAAKLVFQSAAGEYASGRRDFFRPQPAPDVAQADQRPVDILSFNNRGLHLYGDDVFVSHFHFLNRHSPAKQVPTPSLADLAGEQPWFFWNRRRQEYQPLTHGAQKSILRRMAGGGKTITLYRGTSGAELGLLKQIADLPPQELKSALADRLRRGFNALFFTPDLKAAGTWSRGMVVEATIPLATLLRLSREKRIYVGVEGQYPEVAFFDPQAIQELAKLERRHQPPAPGAQ